MSKLSSLILAGVCFFSQNNPVFAQKNQTALILAPREYSRQLVLAQRAIDSEDYAEAIDLLDEMLVGGKGQNAILREDFFVESSDKAVFGDSIRAKAERFLVNMPERARDAYELQYGAEASLLLKQAITSSDFKKLEEVRRRFFATKAGQSAAMLLGRHYLSSGKPYSAVRCFSQLSRSPVASERFKQHLPLLLATSLLRLGDENEAQRTLAKLKEDFPNAQFSVRGKQTDLFESEDQAIAWLRRIVGTHESTPALIPTEWLVFRGNESRNAESEGSLPLLNIDWQIDVAIDPTDQDSIQRILKNARDSKAPLVPSIQPIVVNDTVFMRGARELVAVSLATGKRIWEFPWDNRESDDNDEASNPRQRDLKLSERVWNNGVYGQISSDGNALFLIDDIENDPLSLARQQQLNQFAPGFRGTFNFQESNVLVALDIKTEGKYLWRVGNLDGEQEPALANAFFLGAPLVVGDQLYVIAESNNDVSVFALNPETGKVNWSQQLAHVDQREILMSRTQRRSGATPSFADGVLVCPTTAGAIVALDVANRTLLWGHQYKPVLATRYSSRTWNRRAVSTWLDSAITIVDGKVVFTPSELDELICLDLKTGKSAWESRIKKGDNLFVACVHDNQVVVVGQQKITAFNLAHGRQEWTLNFGARKNVDGTSQTPSGRGFRSKDNYFLPLTSEIIEFDLKTGKMIESMPSDFSLGNLIAYKNHVISLGADYLSAFYRLDRLDEIVNSRLAKNANDAWANEQKGLLLLDAGKLKEGHEFIRRALSLYAPHDDQREGARRLLVDALLKTLSDDFEGNEDLLEEVKQLIDLPAERSRYLIVVGNGMLKSNRPAAAFDAFLELASSDKVEYYLSAREPLMQSIDRGKQHSVRFDRSIEVGIRDALAMASESERDIMMVKAEAVVAKMSESDDVDQNLRGLRYFGDLEISRELRIKATERLLAAKSFLRAEQLIRPILDAPPEIAARAHILLATIYENAGLDDTAAKVFAFTRSTWPEQTLPKNQTVLELVNNIPTDTRLGRLLNDDSDPWPVGLVEQRINDTPQEATVFRNRGFASTSTNFKPLAIHETVGRFSPDLRIQMDGTSTVGIDGLGFEQFRIQSQVSALRTTKADLVTCKNLGGLYVLNYGVGLAAVNGLGQESSQSRIIWPENLRGSTTKTTITGGKTTSTDRWGKTKTRIRGSEISSIGSLSHHGMVYLHSNKLICVDPLTGEVLWSRADLKPGTTLWGDDKMVFASSRGSLDARVFDVLDGRELGQRGVKTADKIHGYFGRNILFDTPSQSKWLLRMYDPWESKIVWEHSFAESSKADLDEDGLFAAVEPDGKCRVIDCKSGDVLIDGRLDLPERPIIKISLVTSPHQFIFDCSSAMTADPAFKIQSPQGASGSITDSLLFAFDRKSGKQQWESPVIVKNFSRPFNQPAALPTLLFWRWTYKRGAAASSRRLEAVCIDKRDGRSLLELKNQPIQLRGYQMTGNPKTNTVTLRLTSKKLHTFQFTDKPKPAEPPAQIGVSENRNPTFDKLKAAAKVAGRSIEKAASKLAVPTDRIGEQIGDALIEQLTPRKTQNAIPKKNAGDKKTDEQKK